MFNVDFGITKSGYPKYVDSNGRAQPVSKLPAKLKKALKMYKKILIKQGVQPNNDPIYVGISRILLPFCKSLSCISNLAFNGKLFESNFERF